MILLALALLALQPPLTTKDVWDLSSKVTTNWPILNGPHSVDQCMKYWDATEGLRGYIDAHPLRVLQVLDSTSMLVSTESSNAPVLLFRDIDTSNLVDDKRIVIVGIVEALGTKQYQTAIGTRQVREFQIVPFRKPDMENREFTIGDDRIEASVASFSKDKVKLKLPTGKFVSHKYEKFSDEDQQFLRFEYEIRLTTKLQEELEAAKASRSKGRK